MGDIMLFASLIFDGLTGAMQEKIRAQNQEQKQRKIVTPLVMMSTLNSYASIGKIFKCNHTINYIQYVTNLIKSWSELKKTTIEFDLNTGTIRTVRIIVNKTKKNLEYSKVTLIMSVSSSETIPAFNFLANHPRIIGRIALLSLCSSFGQICIFICVIYFGALTASIVTTLS